MNARADSAQIISFIGAIGSFMAANYDRVAATICALVCAGYTVWKWHRAAKRAEQEAAQGAAQPEAE